MGDEKDQYIEELKRQIEDLESRLKATEEDRDETKLGLQRMIGYYAKEVAKNEKRDVQDVYAEIGNGVAGILDRAKSREPQTGLTAAEEGEE